MAKVQMSQKKDYPYPSRFGSHKIMVVREEGENVVCVDEFGEYTTNKQRLDDGIADPKRYAEKRIQKLFQGRENKEEKK
jgi:hypothetical protein